VIQHERRVEIHVVVEYLFVAISGWLYLHRSRVISHKPFLIIKHFSSTPLQWPTANYQIKKAGKKLPAFPVDQEYTTTSAKAR